MKKPMRRWRYELRGYPNYKGYVLANSRADARIKASEAMDKKAEKSTIEPPVSWTYDLWEVKR